MMGMSEETGELIAGETWLSQAVRRAVRTPLSSKLGMRWFGTHHLKYFGRIISEASILDLTEEVSRSVERGIPGVRVETLAIDSSPESLRVEIRGKNLSQSIGV